MDKLEGASVRIAPLDRTEMLLKARKLLGYASGETQLVADANDAQKTAFREKEDEA